MKKIIKNVLEDLARSQLNFESESARETIASLLASTLKSKGCYTEYDDSETTDEYNPDTEGMTGHDHGMVWKHDLGGSYLEPMKQEIIDIPNDMKLGEKIRSIKEQIYREMTADGLPEGGDTRAVLESQKLAEEIVNGKNDSWIYESPDGGKTVFRRMSGSYDSKDKLEIDWETKLPTGRVFSDYNNGTWNQKDEG